MAFKNNFTILALLGLIFIRCNTQSTEKYTWQSLFNGNDLKGWDTYLGPGYNHDQSNFDSIPLGLNNDPKQVFSVIEEDGENVIRISGENFGGISTIREFKDYHLQLEFKWGSSKWAPRKNEKRDSGLLYHAVGPHGADYGFWMRSQEFQIQEGDCGDYWGVAGGMFDIRASVNQDEKYIYDKNGDLLTFSATSDIGRRCIKYPDNENPYGQWNKIELYCKGNISVHIVNGVVNMILYNSRQMDNGNDTPLTEGKIQIQSEGAEIFYRNIQIKQIEEIPSEILNGI